MQNNLHTLRSFWFSSCFIHSNVEKQKKFEHINNDLKGQDDISTDGCSTMVLCVDGMGLDGSLGGVRYRAPYSANNCPMKYTFVNLQYSGQSELCIWQSAMPFAIWDVVCNEGWMAGWALDRLYIVAIDHANLLQVSPWLPTKQQRRLKFKTQTDENSGSRKNSGSRLEWNYPINKNASSRIML